MIVELLMDIVFGCVFMVTNSIPNTLFKLPDWLVHALSLIRTGLGIFPGDVWVVCIANGMFWLVVQFTWAIIEWIYKKIPGVD